MKKGYIIAIVVVVVFVAGGAYWFTQSQNSTSNVLPYGATATSTPAPTANPSSVPAATNPAPTPSPVIHNITIQSFAFGPASITIAKGDTVIWTNKDPMGHTVTGDNGGPSSPTIGTNGTYSYTFNSAETFDYHCAIHPSMKGTVVVQ